MRLLLPNIEFECDFDSVIECYQFSGIYILYDGGLVDIKPYKSLLVRHDKKYCNADQVLADKGDIYL